MRFKPNNVCKTFYFFIFYLNWEKAVFSIAIFIIFFSFNWISIRPLQHLHDIFVNKQKGYRLYDT